ncbi:hypothetical protein [Pseudoclavibacter sp. CFCC 13796]|uniref:arsenate reductase/protein-tyrosine-phosphatase family protein n=1 Tax=Pseudoclavibacter sp. CFCC 13796 TaxID=2615179 RepID=UPI001CE455E6
MVCTGNICRSAYAEAALRDLLQHSHVLDVVVFSAGTDAVVGAAMESEMRGILRERYPYAAGTHNAQQLHEGALDEADLVLVMTREHRRRVVRRWPEAATKTVMLTDFCVAVSQPPAKHETDLSVMIRTAQQSASAGSLDVPDPYRATAEVHRRVADALDHDMRAIARWLEKSREVQSTRDTGGRG